MKCVTSDLTFMTELSPRNKILIKFLLFLLLHRLHDFGRLSSCRLRYQKFLSKRRSLSMILPLCACGNSCTCVKRWPRNKTSLISDWRWLRSKTLLKLDQTSQKWPPRKTWPILNVFRLIICFGSSVWSR